MRFDCSAVFANDGAHGRPPRHGRAPNSRSAGYSHARFIAGRHDRCHPDYGRLPATTRCFRHSCCPTGRILHQPSRANRHRLASHSRH